MKRLFIFSAFILSFIHLHAQKTVYLNDESEIVKDKNKAHELAMIRENDKNPKYTVEFFSMDGTLLRSAQYSQFGKTPNKQIQHGKTIYKYSHSEQDSLVCFYRDNLRTGGAIFYYPDGKKHIDCSYKNGNLDGLLIQYYPNDSIKRKDVYKAGIATASSVYSEEGKPLGNNPFYIPPTPIDSDIKTLIREVAQGMDLPLNIIKRTGDWKADVEASFDSNGKLTNIRVVQNNHSGLVAPAIKATRKVLQSRAFKPATMDNHAVNGSIILPILCKIKAVSSPSR